MNILNTIKSAVSYVFAFFAGVYGFCIVNGDTSFFMILGFIACLAVSVFTSLFLEAIFEKKDKTKGRGR